MPSTVTITPALKSRSDDFTELSDLAFDLRSISIAISDTAASAPTNKLNFPPPLGAKKAISAPITPNARAAIAKMFGILFLRFTHHLSKDCFETRCQKYFSLQPLSILPRLQCQDLYCLQPQFHCIDFSKGKKE